MHRYSSTLTLMKSTLLFFTLALQASLLQAEPSGERDSRYLSSKSFTEFIGLDVKNLQNETLGKVKLITVDLQNARVAEVVVRAGGGLFGIGARDYAVAPLALSLDTPAHCLRLDRSPSAFQNGPRYDTSHTNADTARGQVAQVTRHFGLEPWFFEEGEIPVKNAEILRIGPIRRSDQILGLPVSGPNGDYMGHVDALRMDLPKGQVIHVVTRNRNGSAADSVVQPRALRFNPTTTALTYDTNNSNLADEPRFKWTNSQRTSYREEQYVNRDETRQSMEQGANFRDRQKTSRIQSAIRKNSFLSSSARQVRVVTLNAQTTLVGQVGSEEEKRRIGQIAIEAGRLENVSNLIQVR